MGIEKLAFAKRGVSICGCCHGNYNYGFGARNTVGGGYHHWLALPPLYQFLAIEMVHLFRVLSSLVDDVHFSLVVGCSPRTAGTRIDRAETSAGALCNFQQSPSRLI